MLPRKWVLFAPVRARILCDPCGLCRTQLVVRRPDVVVEWAQLRAVPVDAVKVNVTATCPDPGEEVGQPPHGVGRGRDGWTAAPDPGLAQWLDAPYPLAGRELDGNVGLVWQLGLVEAQHRPRAGGLDVLL